MKKEIETLRKQGTPVLTDQERHYLTLFQDANSLDSLDAKAWIQYQARPWHAVLIAAAYLVREKQLILNVFRDFNRSGIEGRDYAPQ